MGAPRDASPAPSRRILPLDPRRNFARVRRGRAGVGSERSGTLDHPAVGAWIRQEEASLGQRGDPRANFLQPGLALFGSRCKNVGSRRGGGKELGTGPQIL